MDAGPEDGGRPPLVSVTVPCYGQAALARRGLETILAQTLPDLELTLLDDGPSDDYRDLAASLRDPRVRYRPNPERLGAMANMFRAIHTGRGRYALAFHEDDLLGRHYLATAVDLLERHPRCGFVAAELREFTAEPSEAELAAAPTGPAPEWYAGPADFVRALCRGRNPMFGSVVYRRRALASAEAAHDRYGTLVDRPFLLSILRAHEAALVAAPMAWYRRHGAGDTRHRGMSAAHILRLFSAYRAALPAPLGAEDREALYAFAGYWLVALYALLPARGRPPLGWFLWRAWRAGVWDPRWQRGYGRRQVLKAVLGAGLRA